MAQESAEGLPVELRHKFAAIRRWQLISRVVTVLAVIVIAGVFYVFASTTYKGVQGNFTEERNQKALEAALPKVTPLVREALVNVATEVGPVYQQLAAERYQRVRDNMGAKALIRLQQVPQDSGKVMGVKLSEAFDRVLKKIEPEMEATFPSLTDAQRRDLIVDHFAKAIEEQNLKISGKIDEVRVNEAGRLKAILDKFALPPDEAAPANDQLRKELVRTMILLAEQELNELDQPVASTPSTQPAGK